MPSQPMPGWEGMTGQCLTARCFGGGGVPTVTVAVALALPAAFVAVSL